MTKGWIQTFTGRKFFPLAPRVDDIDIHDIAHALANCCRFTGHCRSFYSVAQHSVLASVLVETVNASAPSQLQLWALMHDASEAYLCDLASPVKRQINGYADAEAALMKLIAKRFGLPWPMPAAVKTVDRRLVVTEKRDLFGVPPGSWQIRGRPFRRKIDSWAPLEAEETFLSRFRELSGCL
jgi:hypothetical protein